MTMRSIAACVSVLFLAGSPAFAGAQSPPSAEAFYRHALEQTRDRLQPAFATYQAKVDGIDCSILNGSMACQLSLFTKAHSTTDEPIAMSYRAGDDRLAMAQDGHSFVLGDAAFLNATWRGVDELVRYGFVGKPVTAAPQPAPSIDPQSHLPIIAVVSSLAPDHYIIQDEGSATCSNGDPGHMVHLIALRDPLRYPINDAIVDMRTGDLCMLRFGARANVIAGLAGANGVAELDLASQNGYVMVQDERIAINLRAAGIAVKHIAVGIAFSDYTFPQEISPVVFETPEPSPQPSAVPVVSPR